MSDRIRWGILSTANIARNAMIPGIRETDNGVVAAVASRSMDKAKAFADEMEIPKAYGAYEDLLNDDEIDALYNPLPVSLHAEMSIRAAEAGKSVLCEKPMASTADEARRMIDAFKERGLLLSESLMYKYHPLTRKALELIREGRIGDVRDAHATFHVLAEEGNIRLSKATGGGAMLDVGSYCTSILRAMAGEEPETVKATGVFNDEDVDLRVNGILQFPSGVTGRFACSLDTAFDCLYGAHGTGGRLLVDRGAMCAWPGESFSIKCWSGSDYEVIETSAANHYALIAEDFDRALQNGGAMKHVSLDETVNNLETVDRVLEACRA